MCDSCRNEELEMDSGDIELAAELLLRGAQVMHVEPEVLIGVGEISVECWEDNKRCFILRVPDGESIPDEYLNNAIATLVQIFGDTRSREGDQPFVLLGNNGEGVSAIFYPLPAE